MLICDMFVVAAAAFKAGKIQNNPFSQASTAGGAAIPPPANLAGRVFYMCYFFLLLLAFLFLIFCYRISFLKAHS